MCDCESCVHPALFAFAFAAYAYGCAFARAGILYCMLLRKIMTPRNFLSLKQNNSEFAEGLAQSVERLTAEREDAGSIPGAGPILRVLKNN